MECDYEELYKWVEQHTITRPKRNIHRDFSDAIPLVEILKHHYPKLVDLHNYGPKNAFALKVTNWETLNNKILKKIQINLTKPRIEMLAKAENGAIEKLLLEIKKKIDSKGEGDEASDDILIQDSPINSMNAHKRKTISIVVLDNMKKEIAEKGETIEKLKKKVEHVESLLKLKDERIKDLSQQLESLVNQANVGESQSKFFKIFN